MHRLPGLQGDETGMRADCNFFDRVDQDDLIDNKVNRVNKVNLVNNLPRVSGG